MVTNWGHSKHGALRCLYPLTDDRLHYPTGCWCKPAMENGVVMHRSSDENDAYAFGARQPH